jgi:hypothetical protein
MDRDYMSERLLDINWRIARKMPDKVSGICILEGRAGTRNGV